MMAYCDLQHVNMQHRQQDINTDELYTHTHTITSVKLSPQCDSFHITCFSQEKKKTNLLKFSPFKAANKI